MLLPDHTMSRANMETWFIILISLCISALLKTILNLLSTTKKPIHNLPPGPLSIPIISSFILQRKSFSELTNFLRSLCAKLGPIITLRISSRPFIFVADHSLAHQALIQNGAVFADRPPAFTITKIISCNQHNINNAFYGPTWRLLRRNLTSEILHPSRVKSYSHARKWVLQILIDCLNSQSKSGDPVRVLDHFRYAMFCLLVFMCFGDKLDKNQIKEIEDVQHRSLFDLRKYSILDFWPRVTKIVFRKRWNGFCQLLQLQQHIFIPLIRARKKLKEETSSKAEEDNKSEYVLSYVDTLLDLQLPEEKRKLNEKEIVSLCSEFLNAGTDTTSTALQWIMANLVKYPHIQEKLFAEIKKVVRDGEEEVKEDDLQEMPYLKSVILEGLRRHPPTHFVLPHAVTEDTILDGFLVPKNSFINFMVAEMGRDPNVWEDPMAFKPERFINNDDSREVFDLTGSREIKMMPFGVGRRICPGFGLAMLHLEYFVANLIWNFQWKPVDGDEVNMEEEAAFTIVMKNPLQARIQPRLK